MKKEQIITTIMLGIGLVMFCYGAILQDKAKATEGIIELQAIIEQLSGQIADESDNWWIAEDAKAECIQSWEKKQTEANKQADIYREEKSIAEKKLGLLLQRQLQ